MRKTIQHVSMLLTAIFAVAFETFAQEENITLRNKKYTIDEFVSAVEQRTNLTFVLDDDIDGGASITVTPSTNTVSAFLKEAFSGRLNATVLDNYVLVQTAETATASAGWSGSRIRGTVVDENGGALIGATVLLAGSTRGVTTDNRGAFVINLLPERRLLVVSYMGMVDRPIAVKAGEEVLSVELKPNTNTLDELVIIGYGVQAKRDITGAITSISTKDMDRSVGGNIETSLQGKIPGLNIVSNSGEPGSASTITLRGASSINGASEPLYIIDGVPMTTGSISSIIDEATFNPLAGINPAEIESIEVLRDAASAAIYGSQAANGVVIVTTKGGNEIVDRAPTITLNHTSSLSEVSRSLDVMNSQQFRSAYLDARTNAGLSATNEWLVNPTHPYYANSTNWQQLLFRPTYQSKSDVSINGGTDKVSYGISLGYRNTDPIIRGTSYRQASVRTNFSYRLTGNFVGGTKFYYSQTDYKRVITGQSNMSSAIRAIVSAPPVFSPYDYESGDIKDVLGNNEFRNPLALAYKYPIPYAQGQMTFNQYFKYTIMKGLELRVSAALEQRKVEQSSYLPKVYDSNRVDSSRYSNTDYDKWLIENTLTYRKLWGDHSFDVVAGQSWQNARSNMISFIGRDYMDTSLIVIQNASTWNSLAQTYNEFTTLSFFGRANYNYRSRYLASFTLRADGSSRFGSDRRFGYFPSASFGWRFSDEPFMVTTREWLTDAKLRASLGVTGNQNIGNYTWRGQYAANSSGYDGQVTVLNTALSNTKLTWETTTQYNVGVDLSILRGRIAVNADFYIKNTSDLLFNVPLPGYTGFTSRSENFGSIRNEGFELAIQTVNIDTRDLQWTTTFNISRNTNRITQLSSGEDVIYSTKGIYALARVGDPVGLFYGWESLGVYASDSDNSWTNPSTGATRPVKKGTIDGDAFGGGDMIWRDVNNDGIINDDDRVVIGNPHPDFTGGFGSTLTWRNFSLNVYFNYSYGNDVINSQRRLRNKMSQLMNLGTDALSRWRVDGDKTDFPKLVYGDPMDNFRPSNFTVEDGSYIRLKDLSLSYSLPRAVCRKFKMQGITLSLSGSNLLLWSNYTGFDPEVNTSTTSVITGLDDGAFPKSRTYSMGLSLTF